jgi:hypothetical protein
MKNYWIFLLFTFSIVACKNNDQSTAPADSEAVPKEQEPKSYLPIVSFINEDIRNVDAFAAGILLKTKTGQKTDSIFIKPEEFKNIAREFLVPELDTAIFHNDFTEESIAEQATQTVNFIYTSNNDKTILRKAIVYASPSQVNHKISRIYMEKEKQAGDTTIKQKLTWKIKQYFIITEIRQTAQGFNSVITRKAIWDPQLFADQE